ncbi:uncharacterized protein LOC106152545 isoform X1 [Lingula anatina]|uniref:Uncharacterized protein LOC106152545 isoform X1 n=1 Tax=Lingula anatina TaxID=7574 RepID=A0A1S3H6I8_LINAN|nr:uncharacterized protein LOC106152545 isoform X1 [Lingula anatina]|eukprot:XP_013381613.1 uncharacterized protein LOC106152545 isoform X1 [Lingula anatina]
MPYKGEIVPLLPDTAMKGGEHGSAGFTTTINIHSDDEIWEEEANEEDTVLFADGKRRGTSLILNDAVITLLEYVQIFALLQSSALRWVWPETWLKSTYFVFLFNGDIWEFMKFQGNETYKNVQDYYTPSADLTIDFWSILLGWGCLMFLLIVTFIVIYIVLNCKKHPYMLVRVARLQRVYIIILQILAIPVGVTIGKLFHYTDTYKVDVDNTLDAFSGMHWAYIAPAAAFALVYYLIFPAWLIQKTKREILTSSADRHEGYLQLKETEYVQGLDVLWMVSGFHIFSSFKRVSVYFRPALHICKFMLLALYAGLYRYLFWQAVVTTSILFGMLFFFVFWRPYRVSAFNFMLIMSFLCLMFNSLIGAMITSFTPATLQSPWFTPTYVLYMLIIINGLWLLCVIGFLLYLGLKQYGKCPCCGQEPLWPTMTSHGLDKLSPQTRKFTRGILTARQLMEKCLSMPPIFAPAHELSRQIQIINAYCREAEYLRDPIHATLWDLLDELIEAHSQVAPHSVFADSVKGSIRQTAGELMKMMPMFVRRLAQREYDFILLSPLKRRLLLKMYCLGLFLNGRQEKIQKDRLTSHQAKRIWTDASEKKDVQVDDGYYEDMYPERLLGPDKEYRPQTAISFGNMSLAEQNDEDYMNQVDSWTKEHPLSRQGNVNRGFLSDNLSDILGDDVSLNLSEMLDGVPSLSRQYMYKKRKGIIKAGTANTQSGSGSTGSRPGSGGSRPGSAASRPGSAASRPGSRASRPGSGGSRPSSGVTVGGRPELERQGRQGGRPSSAQSRPMSPLARPTSAQSRPISPLARPPSDQSKPISPLAGSSPPQPAEHTQLVPSESTSPTAEQPTDTSAKSTEKDSQTAPDSK